MPGRSGEDLAVRADDHGVAGLHPLGVVRIGRPDLLPVGEVGRDLVDVQARVHADHVAAALAGDVPHGGDPAVARASVGATQTSTPCE